MTPYEFAESRIGTHERPGPLADHPFVLECLSLVHVPKAMLHDETPWCAAFVHRCLLAGGIQGTGKANARSYLQWGRHVPLDQIQQGDVVVFWRESPKGIKGHVAFYVEGNDTHVLVLGGNQGNGVRKAFYPRSRILGVRRATEAQNTRPA